MSKVRRLGWCSCAVLVLVSCGGNDTLGGTQMAVDPNLPAPSNLTPETTPPLTDSMPATPATPVTTPPQSSEMTPVPTPPSTPALPSTSHVTNLAEAVVRIVAQGTIQDPFNGTGGIAVGSGSGFIIDPTGIVVTNNHVVANAAILDVYIGERPEPVTGQVLGKSECSDLAVIDLPGEGYQYFDWFTQPITRGLTVQAVGYPLGVTQLTQTQGIVSKTEAPLATSWASVDAIIEHDARINPGNSGGPLIMAMGDPFVLGVNYAGVAETDQNLAISASVARPLVEVLRTGVNVDWIGINGEAALTTTGASGIGIYSVAPGSPADRAGVAEGDIIVLVADLDPAPDGTMADYCRVLRTQGPQGVIPIAVLRGTDVLEGQINGEPLAFTGSIADPPVMMPVPPAETPPEAPPLGSATCSDTCERALEVGNGICSDGSSTEDIVRCNPGTDCADCGPGPDGCTDTCSFSGFAGDGQCDDGGDDAEFIDCAFGTDCTDCGDRAP